MASNRELFISLRDIRDEGLQISQQFSDEDVRYLLSGMGGDGVEFSDAHQGQGSAMAEATFMLRRMDDQVFLQGSLQGHFWVTCSRCLQPAQVLVDESDLRLVFFQVQPKAFSNQEEVELTLDDLDAYEFEGETLDLIPMIREHLILGIPMMPLCHDDCRGFCVGCGADLNKEPCRCPSSEHDDTTSWKASLACNAPLMKIG